MPEISALAKRQNELEADIEARMPKLAELVPDSASLTRMKRAFLQSCAATPQLYECTMPSLLGALVETVSLGLMTGAAQEAAIVPFKNGRTGKREAVFIPMYQGLLKLAYRSDRVAWVKAEVVYEKDGWHYEEKGDRIELAHTRTEDDDPGELRAVYCKVKIRDESDPMVIVMLRREVLAIKARSRAAQRSDSAWNTDEPAMWKKTVLRQAAKVLPKNDEWLTRAVYLDEQADRGEPQILGNALDDPDLIPDTDDPPGGPIDHSQSPALGEPGQEPTMKHLHAFAREHAQPGEKAHDAIHAVIEPMGIASVTDIPVTQVDEIKSLLRERAATDAEVS